MFFVLRLSFLRLYNELADPEVLDIVAALVIPFSGVSFEVSHDAILVPTSVVRLVSIPNRVSHGTSIYRPNKVPLIIHVVSANP